MIVSYVVLHYMAIKDTVECVMSIYKNINVSSNDKKYIIIVDNGSQNASSYELEKLFGQYEGVFLLKNEENLGFARGNNIGFRYAKYQLKSDFIILLNNDTIIRQVEFNNILIEKYRKTQFAVLGPDIITADGYHQNPGYKQEWKLWELRKFRIKKRIRIFLSYLGVDSWVDKMIEKSKDVYRKETLIGDVANTILHGACLIFSPLYVKNYDGLHEETFLYMEEDILKLCADYYDFLMLYSSDLVVYHKEDVATNMSEGSSEEKKRRKYRLLIESSLVYSNLKKKYEKGK